MKKRTLKTKPRMKSWYWFNAEHNNDRWNDCLWERPYLWNTPRMYETQMRNGTCLMIWLWGTSHPEIHYIRTELYNLLLFHQIIKTFSFYNNCVEWFVKVWIVKRFSRIDSKEVTMYPGNSLQHHFNNWSIWDSFHCLI